MTWVCNSPQKEDTMKVDLNITCSMDEVLKALGTALPPEGGLQILVTGTEDKFFIGGGCEAYVTPPGHTLPANISVCMQSPPPGLE